MFETGPFQTVADQSAGFDQLTGPPASFQSYDAVGDVIDALPGAASRGKLERLRQRSHDARSLWLPTSDEITESRLERQRSDLRLRQLTLPRGAGGPGLGDDNHQVIDIRKKLARIDGDIARLTALETSRGAAMQSVSMLVKNCEAWLRRGRGGSQLVEAAVIEPGEILKRGERLYDGIERLRNRLRELDADRDRTESAAFPSSACKERMRFEIEALAERGKPSCDNLVEHFGALLFPQAMQRFPLYASVADGRCRRSKRRRLRCAWHVCVVAQGSADEGARRDARRRERRCQRADTTTA
jgi:hypothetical protein